MQFQARLTLIVLALLVPSSSEVQSNPAGGSSFTATQTQPEGSAAWVARQSKDRDTGRDSRLELRMRLFDRQGRARERALTMISLRGGRPGAPEGDRLLIRFTYPNDIKGTALLVWEHPQKDDERFLFLPALGRVRRIAGSESQESFAGSDFTYEDIGGREFDDYSYALLADGPWKDPEDRSWPAYHLESRARDTDAMFPRVESLIRKDNFVVVHADVFNRRNELQKTYDARRVERVDGIWTSMEAQMTNLMDRTRTELVVSSARYNLGLKETDFSRRELERGVQ